MSAVTEKDSLALRQPCHGTGKICGDEDVDLLLSDRVADGPANLPSFRRPDGDGPHKEVDISPLFRVIHARAKEENLRLRVVAMNSTHNCVALSLGQPHEWSVGSLILKVKAMSRRPSQTRIRSWQATVSPAFPALRRAHQCLPAIFLKDFVPETGRPWLPYNQGQPRTTAFLALPRDLRYSKGDRRKARLRGDQLRRDVENFNLAPTI
jgi:hypothetical protein